MPIASKKKTSVFILRKVLYFLDSSNENKQEGMP